MAASVSVFGPIGTPSFERRDPYVRLSKAINGDPYELRRLYRGFGNPRESADVFLRATTDSNTAAGSSNVAYNLSTTMGLTVASGAIASTERRDVLLDVRVLDAANSRRYFFQTKTTIGVSASELVIIGQGNQILTPCDCVYGFTTADGTTTTEDAAACIGPGWCDAAAPVAGNLSSNAFTIQWLGGNAPATVLPGAVANHDGAAVTGDTRAFQHGNASATNGTSEVHVNDVATPTAANFTNNSVVRVFARVLPPVAATLSVNTATAPDELILSLVGLAATALTWEVGITVGDAYSIS